MKKPVPAGSARALRYRLQRFAVRLLSSFLFGLSASAASTSINLSVISGADQYGVINQPLPIRFSVMATNSDNQPLPGIKVRFQPNYCLGLSLPPVDSCAYDDSCNAYNDGFGHFESGDTRADVVTGSDGIAIAPPYFAGPTPGTRALMAWIPDVGLGYMPIAIDFVQLWPTPTGIVQGLWEGLWAVVSEQNGLPGRGFQIEMQNGVMVLTVFAYDADGHSDFYQAVGSLSGNIFAAPLIAYRDGRFFGGPPRAAVEGETAGTVTIAFDDTTIGFGVVRHGTIQFPGEPIKDIGKLDWWTSPDPNAPITGLWAIADEVDGQPGRGFHIEVQDKLLVLTVFAYEESGRGAFYEASGALEPDLPCHVFSAPLISYKNGIYFGSPNQNPAEGAGSAGRVTLSFIDTIHGTIQLPNEPVKQIVKLPW